MENIKVKCPECGTVLAIKPQPGIESKSIKCPACNEKNMYSDFLPFRPVVKNMVTALHDDTDEDATCVMSDRQKEQLPPVATAIGMLEILNREPSKATLYQLKMGRNVIGRKATASTADFQIPLLPEQKKMSREHMVIDVEMIPGRGLTHQASLYKEQVNETLVNGVALQYGEKVPLKDQDRIRLPHAELLFTTPDDEKTEIVMDDGDGDETQIMTQYMNFNY